MKYITVHGIDDLHDVVLKPVIVPNAEDYMAVWDKGVERTISIVSNGYALVPHKVVANAIWKRYPEAVLKVSEDQSRLYGFMTFMEKRVEVVKGDFVSMGLRFRNSYNKSASLSAEIFANRLICNNGMTMPSRLMGVKAKHYIGAIDEFFRGFEYIDFEAAGIFLQSLPDVYIRVEDLRNMLSGSKIPEKYVKEFDFKDCKTGWDYLNAMTVVLTHKTDKCSLDRKILLEKEAVKIIEEVRKWDREHLIV